MPSVPLPRRPAREPDEPLLDMILAGQPLPPGAPPDARALAEKLADLADPAEPGVLPGEAAALSAFARTAPPAGVLRRPGRRRPRLRAALGATLVAVTVGLGGVVAAYADVLPDPVQDLAHQLIGAPPAHAAMQGKPEDPGKIKYSRTGAGPASKPVKASKSPESSGSSKSRAASKPPRPAPLTPTPVRPTPVRPTPPTPTPPRPTPPTLAAPTPPKPSIDPKPNAAAPKP